MDWVSELERLFTEDVWVTHVAQTYTPFQIECLLMVLITEETSKVPQSYRYFLEEARKRSLRYNPPVVTMDSWMPYGG